MKLIEVYEKIAEVLTNLKARNLDVEEARTQLEAIADEANDSIAGSHISVPSIEELRGLSPAYESSYESSACW